MTFLALPQPITYQEIFMDRTRGRNSLTWRTALSCDGGACVQVAADRGIILIRSSRQPSGPLLEYTPEEWHEFVSGVKKGDFDSLN
jgi:predicted secreted Zn-dependent protease